MISSDNQIEMIYILFAGTRSVSNYHGGYKEEYKH